MMNGEDFSPSRYPRDTQNDENRGRARSKTRPSNEMDERFEGPSLSSRHQPMTRSHTTIEPRMQMNAKNKARNRSIERKGSSATSHLHSPPSPMEAQATLEKILPR